jgi:hypothetical protein
MAKTATLAAYLYNIHRPNRLGFEALSVGAYSQLLHSLESSPVSRVTLQTPKEFELSSSSVGDLAGSLIKVMSSNSKKKGKTSVVVLQMLDKEDDVHDYDDLCVAIDLALHDPRISKPWCVVIAVSNEEVFNESVLLRLRLIPTCRTLTVGLILLSVGEQMKSTILNRGNLPRTLQPPVLQSPKSPSNLQEKPVVRLTTAEIADAFQVLFGHFEIGCNGKSFHVPAVASVQRLLKNDVFLRQLNDDISSALKASDFVICPFGIAGGGIDELSLMLTGRDANRLKHAASIKDHDGSPLVILCDFASSIYGIEDVIAEARMKGTDKIAVAAIARYQNAPAYGVKELHYLETDYKAVPASDPSCKFCMQGMEPPIKGDHFDSFARRIGEFDDFTFWEFIAQSREFYDVKHWWSERTHYHYHFRIMAKPIFKRYSYDLSLRLKNVIERKGILPGWVKKIVCTGGEESMQLSVGLAEVLGLGPDDVIPIPRDYFTPMAGDRQLNAGLATYVEEHHIADSLRKQNVLIVDQAAHHFGTLSALRHVCEYFECTVLAFAVFIDRTDKAFYLGDYLPNSHYIALYSWHVPPRRPYECPCTNKEHP